MVEKIQNQEHTAKEEHKNTIQLLLANPRGFCAGVSRAIEILNLALKKFGAPIYVKHDIVHNKKVVQDFEKQGVIFLEDVSKIPVGSVVIFSAHGVSDEVEQISKDNKLLSIDATCPLVKKVHRSVIQYSEDKDIIVLIGHKGHPEIEGTSGRIKGEYHIVESIDDVDRLDLPENATISIATQTTLSIDDTKAIVDRVKYKFNIPEEKVKNDICYATQNRQDAVRDLIGKEIDLLLIVGSKNSSNSNRLRDIGEENGIKAILIDSLKDIKKETILQYKKVGLSAGASAPDELINEIIEFFRSDLDAQIVELEGKKETIEFHSPRIVRK